MKRKKKLIAYLNGGLGNQMFQYAAARAIAWRTESELVLDPWSGFVRDFQYHRSYELDKLPIKARAATLIERLPIWLYRAENRFLRHRGGYLQRRLYGQFLVETELAYREEFSQVNFDSTAWLVGYWQNPKYFQEFAETVRRELTPPAPSLPRFLDLGQSLRSTESVALCIRLYEESADPRVHARDGRLKTVAELNSAITRMHSARPNAEFFVFCTHRSRIFDELKFPVRPTFVTHADGYEGSLESLWLLTQCKHHIITNSTYYWWGAWLSADTYQHRSGRQLIFAADNFVNRDSMCAGWEKF